MNQCLDFIGIGIGPSNLSIAALGSEIAGFNCKFLERKPHFSWHPGMILADWRFRTESGQPAENRRFSGIQSQKQWPKSGRYARVTPSKLPRPLSLLPTVSMVAPANGV